MISSNIIRTALPVGRAANMEHYGTVWNMLEHSVKKHENFLVCYNEVNAVNGGSNNSIVLFILDNN